MGLAFLPWERLPAYVFGPLLCALNVWLFVTDDHSSLWYGALEIAGFAFGVWMVWHRYKTGEEPFAPAKPVEAPGGNHEDDAR